MGFFDIFKSKEYKHKISELETLVDKQANDIRKLNSMLTPEQASVLTMRNELEELSNQIEAVTEEIKQKNIQKENLSRQIDTALSQLSDIETIKDIESMKRESQKQLNILQTEIHNKQKLIIELDEQVILQDFGLYEPKYDFQSSEEYKARLQTVRQNQKMMIRSGTATTGFTNWTVNNSAAKGRKMVKDMQKLLLRAFNSECDEVVDKVKYNSFDSALKRITASYDAISKLGAVMGVSIAEPYYDSKIDELTIALEYRIKKQEEKEQQRELRAQLREEAKLKKEIEAERKRIEKEFTHYQNALTQIEAQIASTDSEEKRQELLAKKSEIEASIEDINKALKDIDYREANQRAGYVYIISNIGSFGENIFKIGMTRRLDPTERIDELSDASVPFNFDIHAMIFSDDAPKLEATLHKAFADKKLNLVNQRREFFHVSLDEIKEVIKQNFDKTVEFKDIAEAEQYRISQKMKANSLAQNI